MSTRITTSLMAIALALSGSLVAQTIYEDFQYDALGNVTQHRGPVYGPTPNPAELLAQTHQFTYQYSNGYSLLQQATHPGGQIESWTWDALYRVTSHDLQSGAMVESYTYDANGRIASRTVTSGSESYTWTYAYLAGNRTMTTDFRGAITLDTLDSSGRLVQSAGPGMTQAAVQAMITAGQYRQTTYDSNGDLVQIRNEAGAITYRTYDSTHDMISETDENGLVTSYDFDSQRRVTKVTRPGVSTALGSEFTAYDSAGRVEAEGIRTSSSSVTWIGNRYDASGNVVAHHGPATSLAAVQVMIANQSSQLDAAAFDALNRRTTTFDGVMNPGESIVLDARNLETSHTYFGLGTATNDFDASNRLSRNVDSAGLTRTFVRDSLGRPITETGPWVDANADGIANDADPAAVAQRSYNLAGLEISLACTGASPVTRQYLYTDLVSASVAGLTITYTRDAAGRCTEVRANGVLVASYAFDVVGRPTTSRMAPGTSDEIRVDYVYDAGGRVTSIKRYPVALSTGTVLITTYTYDASGNVSRIVEPTGNGYSYTYDLAGQVLTSTPDGMPATTYAYDLLGRLTYKKVGGDPAWTFTYDSAGYLATAVHGAQSFSLTHDANGRLTSQTEPGGVTYTFTYDSAGNIVQAVSSIGSATRSYTYDAHERLVAVQEGATWYQFAYDGSGRLTSTTNAFGEVFSYYYDSVGRKIAAVYPNSDAFTYAYDSQGRLTTIALVRGSVTEPILDATYDSIGRVVTRKLRGLVDERFAFDGCGRINDYSAKRASTTLVHRVYKYLGDDRIFEIDHAANDIETFQYKSFGALASAKRTGPNAYTLALTYDSAGRIATSTEGGVATTFTYDSAGRLVTAVKGSATTTYTYDAGGRAISRTSPSSSRSYTYDAWGRVASLTTGAVTTQFYRDPFGSILGAITGSSIRYFTLGPDGDPVLSYDNWVLEEESYGTAVDSKLWAERSGVDHVVLSDPISGSVIRTLDETTLQTAGFEYDPLGGSLATSGSTWNADRYQGMRFDVNHGIYWNGARFYDPADGRFVEPDPLRATSLEFEYARVANDPTNQRDPSGMCKIGRVDGTILPPIVGNPIVVNPGERPVLWQTSLATIDISNEQYIYINPYPDHPCYPTETDFARTSYSGNAYFEIQANSAGAGRYAKSPAGLGLRVGQNAAQVGAFSAGTKAVALEVFVRRFLENAIVTLGGVRSFMTHDAMAAYTDAKINWILQRDRIIAALESEVDGDAFNSAWSSEFGKLTTTPTKPPSIATMGYPIYGTPWGGVARDLSVNYPRPIRIEVGPTEDELGFTISGLSLDHPALLKAADKMKEVADTRAAAVGMSESPCECRHTRSKQEH